MKLVVAEDGELMPIPAPPAVQAHEYEYGPTPPDAVAVTEPVVSVDDAPVMSSAVAERDIDGVLTRAMETETVVVAVCP